MLFGVNVSTWNVVVTSNEPGAIKVEGKLKTTLPVVGEAVIWFVVPATDRTPVLEIVIVPTPSTILIPVPSVNVESV